MPLSSTYLWSRALCAPLPLFGEIQIWLNVGIPTSSWTTDLRICICRDLQMDWKKVGSERKYLISNHKKVNGVQSDNNSLIHLYNANNKCKNVKYKDDINWKSAQLISNVNNLIRVSLYAIVIRLKIYLLITISSGLFFFLEFWLFFTSLHPMLIDQSLCLKQHGWHMGHRSQEWENLHYTSFFFWKDKAGAGW